MSMKKEVSDFINEQITGDELAGASLSVIKDGKIMIEEVYGYANLADQVRIQNDTIFRMYSMTKPITATAIMMLWERKKLNITDPVSKYLSGFKNQKVCQDGKLVEVNREVMIKDLLNMTSGIPYPSEENISSRKMKEVFDEAIRKAKTKEAMTTIELCNCIGQVPLMFQPGERFLYGASADILGGIVEIVSGMSYSKFLKTEIFFPLDMMDTDFYVPDEKRMRLATIYYCNESGVLSKEYTGEELVIVNENYAPSFESGGAGLFSTIADYKKFATMLLQKGMYEETRYLKRETIEYMTTNQLNEEQLSSIDWPHLKGYGYGNLMRVLLDDKAQDIGGNCGEYGWDGWAGTYVAIDPVANLIILYFIQRLNKEPAFERCKIRKIVYEYLG